MKSTTSKACDITPKVRAEVLERDKYCCVYCGALYNLQIAHYRPRSLLGLGVKENLVTLCFGCHERLDKSADMGSMKQFVKGYLKASHEDWNEEDLIYRRGI